MVDVPCWVSELASTYDLHYDQRRNACWWMNGDSGQKEEGGEVKEEMEGGQLMVNIEEILKMCVRYPSLRDKT